MTGLIALTVVNYATERLEGWTLKVDRAVFSAENRAAWQEARRELHAQLIAITRAVREPRLGQLRRITVWVHNKGPWTQCMAYHPSAEWLRENGLNPDMAKGIEIGDIRTFDAWTRDQPWMVLHELAHGFHDRFLQEGFGNPAVAYAFRQAQEGSRYERVLRISGRTERHYALTNPMEYFAEATEAYFGRNDFFPFVRPELAQFDPAGYRLMQEVWGPPAS
jgi:hypothetical protein